MSKRKNKELKHVAVLDDVGTLVGFDEVEVPDPRIHIEVPRECGLDAGKYHWHDRLQRFDPILKKAPDPITAIAAALVAIRDGQPLPEITLAWLAWWETHKDNARNN